MDYKQKYEQTLERAKVINPETADYEVAVKIFSELQESESEKIRKELIHFVRRQIERHDKPNAERDEIFDSWITWLEKQKDHEDELERAYKCADEVQYRKGYEAAKREFEKQGEQNNKHLYDVIIALWDLLDKIDTFSDLQIDDTNTDNPFKKIEYIAQERHKFVKSDGYNLYIQGEQITDFKQDEQKPTDKVEPKFKVGDTIVEKDLDEYDYETIKDIKDGQYIFTDGYCINIDEQEG